jgi:hypothetical protein
VIVTVLFAAIVAGVAVARGGSLERLAETKFRWAWLVVVGLSAQIAIEIWSPPWLDDDAGLAVLLGSNAIVALFLAVNWRLAGIAVAALGMALNVVVIAANGAMPVSQRALDKAGYEGNVGDLDRKHEILDADTKLPWLADVIPVPYLRTIISLGDIVLAIGIGQLVYSRTRDAHTGKHLARDARERTS